MPEAAFFGVDAHHPIALAWAELLTRGGALQAAIVIAGVLLAWVLGRRLILPRIGGATPSAEAMPT